MAATSTLRALAIAALASTLTGGCGSSGSDAARTPRRTPSGLQAYCDPDSPAIAAHPSHARARMACVECHAPCAPGPDAPRVAFGPLARTGGASPSWDPGARTCSGVYCHLAGAQPPALLAWTYLDPDRTRPPEEACATCHAYPPPPPHAAETACHLCHPLTVRPDATIDLAGGRHVDGRIDASCAGCHGAPPATGAHLAHSSGVDPLTDGYGSLATLEDASPGASPQSAGTAYAFGCGHCHPLDPALHRDGRIDVELWSASAPPGSLKARASGGAAWEPGSGSCAGTYCHSDGLALPTFVASPAWSGGPSPGCGGCHGNPPSYPSGGAGAADANSHVNLADDGWEFGHFLGLPGPFHTSRHGYEGAAPITCQTCHFDTVDPSNTGAGGFSYLDTTGSYLLPGGDPDRHLWGWDERLTCATCHTGAAGEPQQGTGRILPLRHVNGRRDVVFDPRTALAAIPGLPPPPNTPSRPYWMADGSRWAPWPAGVAWNGTTVSFSLGAAAYDPTTKACSGVACHLSDNPVWGRPYLYLDREQTCLHCHPY